MNIELTVTDEQHNKFRELEKRFGATDTEKSLCILVAVFHLGIVELLQSDEKVSTILDLGMSKMLEVTTDGTPFIFSYGKKDDRA